MDKKKNCTKSSVNIYKPDIEAFTKLWSNLKTFYEGTNVIRTVARLLHIYQPEDGIHVYAKLLRTLHVMLENFDPKGFCTLASMVPPPTGVSEITIEKIFYDTTGYYRLNAPVLRFNNNICHFSESQTYCKRVVKQNITPVPSSRNSVINSGVKKFADETSLPLKKRKTLFISEYQKTPPNAKPCPSKVPPMKQTVQLVTSRPLQLYQVNVPKPFLNSNLSVKWTQAPISSQNKLLEIQSSKVGITNKNLPNKNSLIVYENKNVSTKQQNESESGQRTSSSVGDLNDLKKCEKDKEDSVKFFQISAFKQMDEQEKKTQQAIREEIYKMDYVQNDFEKCTFSAIKNYQDNPFEIKENLKQSLKNYLKRVRNGITCDVPVFPETRPIISMQLSDSSTVNMIKKDMKVLNAKFIKQKSLHEPSVLNKITNSSYNKIKPKEAMRSKTKRKRPEPPTRPRSERVAQRNLLSQNLSAESKINSTSAKRSRNAREKINHVQNSTDEYSNTKTITMLTNTGQSKYPTMEMTTYKKQYCDALMSIQKAKIAVANSLAISSVSSTPSYYPYYFNYYNGQNHMMQQGFIMDPYCQNNWGFQSYGQYRMPQPAHTVYCTMNATNHKYSMISGAYFQSINNSEELANINQSKIRQQTNAHLKNLSNGSEDTFQSYH